MMPRVVLVTFLVLFSAMGSLNRTALAQPMRCSHPVTFVEGVAPFWPNETHDNTRLGAFLWCEEGLEFQGVDHLYRPLWRVPEGASAGRLTFHFSVPLHGLLPERVPQVELVAAVTGAFLQNSEDIIPLLGFEAGISQHPPYFRPECLRVNLNPQPGVDSIGFRMTKAVMGYHITDRRRLTADDYRTKFLEYLTKQERFWSGVEPDPDVLQSCVPLLSESPSAELSPKRQAHWLNAYGSEGLRVTPRLGQSSVTARIVWPVPSFSPEEWDSTFFSVFVEVQAHSFRFDTLSFHWQEPQ